MGIGKAKSACRESVDVGSSDQASLAAVTLDVADAKVVCKG
ncbi:MAG: hypothetical protein R3C56_32330 [Pirellulaceae bacterium]